MKNLFGIIPPAKTAFDRDGRLDENSVVNGSRRKDHMELQLDVAPVKGIR